MSSIYIVSVVLAGEDGTSYRDGYGYAEYTGPDAESKAFAYAQRRVATHPDAVADIHRNGDPYAWVYNGLDTSGPPPYSRSTALPRCERVGAAAPDYL